MARKMNLDTVTHLDDKFKYVFLVNGGCIRGFRYMRKVIIVDETYLAGIFHGTLLLATS